MRLWRLLVELEAEVWTFVVAAADHARAWRMVLEALPRDLRARASLEELVATYEPRVTGQARILHAWRSAGRGTWPGPPGALPQPSEVA